MITAFGMSVTPTFFCWFSEQKSERCLQEGGLFLEILAIRLAEITKCIFAHSEVLEILLLFAVWVNPSHASPEKARIIVTESLLSWSYPKLSRRSQGTNQLLEGGINKRDDQSNIDTAVRLLCRLWLQFRMYFQLWQWFLCSWKMAWGCEIERR